ncbi:dihydrofolate reductase family protein [Frankia sp. Mgl5]
MIRKFLAADLIDHLHVAVVPTVLGRGTRMWEGLEGLEKRFMRRPSRIPFCSGTSMVIA